MQFTGDTVRSQHHEHSQEDSYQEGAPRPKRADTENFPNKPRNCGRNVLNLCDKERREDRLQSEKELREKWVETGRNVARTAPQMRPLRLAKPLQHRCAPLHAPPVVRRRQELTLHLWESHEIRMAEKNKDFDRYQLLRQCSAVISLWRLRRLRSIPDACRRLRTLATEQHGTVSTQGLISILATSRS